MQPDQEKSGNQFAWVASADLRQVRQRLGELRRVRTLLHQEERLLHMRRQELDPASGRPLKSALSHALLHALSHALPYAPSHAHSHALSHASPCAYSYAHSCTPS